MIIFVKLSLGFGNKIFNLIRGKDQIRSDEIIESK